MKKRGGGSAKGASFERWVCKTLSLWESKGESEDYFWRTSMSGGRATLGRKKGEVKAHLEGDIGSVSGKRFLTDNFVIECKHYRDLKLGRLISGPIHQSLLYKFWEKLNEITPRTTRLHPLLIARDKNCQYPLFCTTPSGAKLLGITAPSIIDVRTSPIMRIYNMGHVLEEECPSE